MMPAAAPLLPLEKLRKEADAQPRNLMLKQQLAEKIFSQPAPARDLPLLHSLASEVPDSLRFTWLIFQTELDLHRYDAAAHTAFQLATRVAALER